MSIFTFLRSFKWGAVLFLAAVSAWAETVLWHVYEGRQVRVDHITDEGVFVRSAVGPQAAPSGGILRLEGLSREVALKGLFVPRIPYAHSFSRRKEDVGKQLFNLVWSVSIDDWIADAIRGMELGANAVLLAGFFSDDALEGVFWSPLIQDSAPVWQGRHIDFFPRGKFGHLPLLIFAYDLDKGVVDLGGSFPEAADFVRAVWMDDRVGVDSALASQRSSRPVEGRGGWELTHWAAAVKTAAALHYLRSAEVNPRRADSRGWTPLHHAAVANNPEAVRFLLDQRRTRIDAVDSFGVSALCLAVSTADEDVVDMLLSGGASPTNANRMFACPLQRILHPPREEMADVFLRHYQRNHRLPHALASNYLMRLIAFDQPQLVRLLTRYGRLELDETYGTQIPIAVAAGHASVQMLELLVEKGVSVEMKLPNGLGLLHMAAASNARVIPWLIAQGLDPNATTDKGENPLFVALHYRNVEAIIALLAHGADPNSVDSAGEHLLWLATRLAQREAVTHLVDAGAVCHFTPETALALMEDAFRFDVPEVFEISLAQCLEPDFVFNGGFPGWGVAGRYGAERVQEAFVAAGLKEEDQQDLALDSSPEVRAQIRAVHASLPPYPLELQRKYGTQRIRVDVIIDREGRARFPILLDNPIPELADSFLDHFRAWRFEPLDLAAGFQGVRAILPIRLEVDEEELRIYEDQEISEPPRPLLRTPPTYPVDLNQARITGQVVVQFVILRDGTVDPQSITIIEATNPRFIPATKEAVASWRFRPGLIGDRPVSTRVRQRIPFQLN